MGGHTLSGMGPLTSLPTRCAYITLRTAGGYSVFTSAVLKGATLNPVVYAFLRDVFGSIVLLAAGWVTEARRPAGDRHFWPDRADTGHFTLLGLFMVWGAQGMSAMAIANLTPVFFSMTQPAMPVVTLCMSWAMGA